MKKIALAGIIIGSFLTTSCKEVTKGASDLKNKTVETAGSAVDATKDAANAAADKASDMVSSAIEGIAIPSFANEAITKNLTEYAAYAKDYIAANGNLAKISELAPKGATLLAKGKELASKLDPKEMAKYKSVLSAIQSKMAPAK